MLSSSWMVDLPVIILKPVIAQITEKIPKSARNILIAIRLSSKGVEGSSAPHFLQNLSSSLFSVPHLEQRFIFLPHLRFERHISGRILHPHRVPLHNLDILSPQLLQRAQAVQALLVHYLFYYKEFSFCF